MYLYITKKEITLTGMTHNTPPPPLKKLTYTNVELTLLLKDRNDLDQEIIESTPCNGAAR
jgi:hypothetical protein